MSIYDAAKRCVEAFRLRDEDLIKGEIAAFIQHQSDMHVYNRLLDVWQASLTKLKKNRTTHVTKGLEMYDRKLILEAEARVWSWSPLHLRLLEKPAPDFLQLPCLHNEEEFQDILTWIRAEGGRPKSKVDPPPFVRALKLFFRHSKGVEAPLSCPRMGVTFDFVHEKMTQVKLAMKDLLTFGQLVFPTMDTNSQDFEAYLKVLRTENGFEAMLVETLSWMRTCFWSACLDMLAMDKEDDLRVLWLDASKDRRKEALEAFRRVMLLRESFDTQYALGWLDWTGDWAAVPVEMVEAMKDMNRLSMNFCSDKLSGKNTKDSGTSHLAILEEQELENLDVGQVLTNKSDLRDDAPLDSAEKCNVEGTEDVMGDTLMEEAGQVEEATVVYILSEMPQSLVVEDACNAIVDDVVKSSVIS